jgi:phosphoribosylformylglycinamidine synthase
VNVRVESTNTPFTHELRTGNVLTMPIAHAEGNYVCDDATLAELQRDDRIIFRYSDAAGLVSDATNVNGSRDNIAGICSRGRNVMGLMPHPERACEDSLGSSDGRAVFHSLAGALAAAAA